MEESAFKQAGRDASLFDSMTIEEIGGGSGYRGDTEILSFFCGMEDDRDGSCHGDSRGPCGIFRFEDRRRERPPRSSEAPDIETFDRTNRILYESTWKSQFLSGMMQPIMMFVGNLGYASVAISGGLLAIRGVIGIGDIQAFIQYVKNFTQPITQIAQVTNQLQSMAAATERVFEFLEEEEEIQTTENPADVRAVIGNVEFDHVSFGYDPQRVIIKDFSAKVKQGQKIAIVGPTGAGKTTMVKLLMRFYDVAAGAIKTDGRNVKEFNRRELRERSWRTIRC